MRLNTIIYALGALGLAACATNTDTNKSGDTSGGSDCENQVKSTYPENGEQAADYLNEIGGAEGVKGDVLVRIKPERWLTADFSKIMG